MSNRKAVRAFFDSTRVRPQVVLTPYTIKADLDRLWPEGVELDPCHAPGSIVGARRTLHIPPRRNPAGREVFVGPDEQNGLIQPWVPRTYVNPPFVLAKDWLVKAMREGSKPGAEHVVLVPVRTSRDWYQAAMRDCSSMIWLRYSIRFLGYTDTYPQALSMMYWGPQPAAFEAAFSNLGWPA